LLQLRGNRNIILEEPYSLKTKNASKADK